MEVWIVPHESFDEALVKCYRDDRVYWRLCQALEKGQHGILSSYLIYKNLGMFATSSVRGAAEEWGLDPDEAKNNIILGDILYAIAQHTFDFSYLSELSSLADILVLADDIEEFSRYGRKLFSRKYYDTMANTSIDFIPAEGRTIAINITYEVADHRDLFDFFILKANRLCSTYSLFSEDSDTQDERNTIAEIYEIDSITMTTEQKGNKISFSFCRDSQHRIEINGNPYDITCHDDTLYCNNQEFAAFFKKEFWTTRGGIITPRKKQIRK